MRRLPARALCAAGLLFGVRAESVDATFDRAEFRRAVDAGHRDRLAQVCPACTPLELQLARPNAAFTTVDPARAEGAAEQDCLLSVHYALARGDGSQALRAATTCLAGTEAAGGHEAQWLLAQSEFVSGRLREALERGDWLSRHAKEPWKGRGLFVQAQCALALDDTAEAIRLFKMCTRLSGHEVAAPAYLELGALHEARGESDRALHHLSLYRESFPRGILPQFDVSSGGSSRADVAAGVEYTVQVGVFGDRGNAVRLSEELKAAGFKADLVPKTIAGQRYTAVWVGRYRSQNEAQEARRRLELRYSETYRVVVRE